MDLKIVLLLSIISGGVEILVCKFSKGAKVKFILPAILAVLSTILILIGKFAPLEGMQDLAYMVTGILVGICAAASLVVAIAYSFMGRKGDKR
jgi:hypothetical protein